MAITVVSIWTGSGTGSSITVTNPASGAAGDILLVAVTQNRTNGTTPPSGWTQIEASDSPGGGIRSCLFYKIDNGSEPGSWSFTTGPNADTEAAMAIRFRGVSGAVYDVHTSQANSASGVAAIPSITTTKDNDLHVIFVHTTGVGGTTGGITGYTNDANSAPNRAINEYSKIITPAGATGSLSVSLVSPAYSMVLEIALQPPTVYTQTNTGGLSFAGAIAKKESRSLPGVLSFVGAHTRNKTTAKAVTGALSFVGANTRIKGKSFTAGLTFVGSVVRKPLKTLGSALTFVGGVGRRVSKAFTAVLTFKGSYFSNRTWIEQALAIKERLILIFSFEKRDIKIVVKEPIEVAYKRGTDVLFETTFTDRDGLPIDPDPNTAKLYCKNKRTGVYLTNYDRATGGQTMTKIAVGVYQMDVQFLLTDSVDYYEVECEGYIGPKRSLDSIVISVRA